jgi:serine/threonine-protein kinase ATR
MLLREIDSVITSIDPELLTTAAFQCKAYARALMTLERLITTRRNAGVSENDLQPYYERLHLLYASLNEPDGMEGVTTRVAMPSLDHQIREHQIIGRWTAAQSCWELKLQESPGDVNLHLGLLQCLRNLGHHGRPKPLLSNQELIPFVQTPF